MNTPTAATAKQTRANAQNRKSLVKVNSTHSQRTISRTDVGKAPAELLVELVRDTRVSIYQFRRMAMCAGAEVSDFFDTETGRPLLTKADIMLQIAAGNRAVTYAPKFMTTVSNWLGDSVVRASDIVAALVTAGVIASEAARRAEQGKGRQNSQQDAEENAVRGTTDDDQTTPIHRPNPRAHPAGLHNIRKNQTAKRVQPSSPSVLPSSDGSIPHVTGTLPKVAGVLAASYIVLRGVFAGTYTRKQSRLVTLISGEQSHNKDVPFRRVQQLSPLLGKRTYMHTRNCLQKSYDVRLHEIFAEHQKLPDIRKKLLALRKPWFFGGRSLLALHLIRRNGQIRDSAAEVAYALLHEYRASEVFDAAISYSAATVTNIFRGMKKTLGNTLSVFSSNTRKTGGGTRTHTHTRTRRQARRRAHTGCRGAGATQNH